MSSVRSLLFLTLPAASVLADGAGVIRSSVKAITAPVIAPATNVTRRQDSVGLKNHDSGTLYTIDLAIGTAPQPMTVIIDTGSNELWVNPDCSKVASTKNKALCQSFPVFNPDTSTTYVDLGVAGHIDYGKGYVDFEYSSDTVALGGKNCTPQWEAV